MLLLLQYRLYRYFRDREETMRKREKKKRAASIAAVNNRTNSISENDGVAVQPVAVAERRPKRLHSRRRQPHILEIIIVLFAMFGLPISYIVYRKSIDLLRYLENSTTTDSIKSVAMDSKSLLINFTLEPYVYDYEKALSDRLEAMKKYNYAYDIHSIDRRKNLSLEEFHDVYDAKWPVLISDCVPKWPAFKKWNVDYFLKYYGDEPVTMAGVSGPLSSKQMFVLSLSKFLDHLDHSFPNSYTYLQDELFIPRRPKLLQDIGSCNVLQEDFFPLFHKVVRPWWAFLLWGTRFSRSMNHVDPYNWTGTNAVLIGLKRWKLYPPGQDHLVSDMVTNTNLFPLASPSYRSSVDAYDEDSLALHSKVEQAKVIEFYQYPGELLIIPTGWYHQAYNEEPTLAISGQLMNTRNFRVVLEEMLKANNIPRTGFPNNMDKLSPKEQVKEFVRRLPQNILDKGVESTEFVLRQIRDHERKNQEHMSKEAGKKKRSNKKNGKLKKTEL